jgi:hypothetical protein
MIAIGALYASQAHASPDRALHDALKGTRGIEKAELVEGKPVMLGAVAYPARLFVTVNAHYDAAQLRAAIPARLGKVAGLPATLVVVKSPSGVVQDRFPLLATRSVSAGPGSVQYGARVATDGANAAVLLADPATGAARAIVSTGRRDPILALGRSGGTLLAVQGDRVLELDTEGLSLRPRVDLKGIPRVAAIASRAPVVAFVGVDGLIRLQDARDGREVFAVEPGFHVAAIAIAAGGSAVAARGDGVLRLWETGTRTPRWSASATSGQLSFEGDALLVTAPGARELRDAKTGTPRVTPVRR